MTGLSPSLRLKESDAHTVDLTTLPSHIRNTSEYLTVLRLLSQAVEGGIAALAASQLAELKEQIVLQENCCLLLAVVSRGRFDTGLEGHLSLLCPIDQTLQANLRAEHDKLAGLSRRYKALLRHSVRSVSLLASHWQNHAETIVESGDCPRSSNVLHVEA